MKKQTLNLKKGDTPVRASEALVIEPAKSWQRLQQARDIEGGIDLAGGQAAHATANPHRVGAREYFEGKIG